MVFHFLNFASASISKPFVADNKLAHYTTIDMATLKWTLVK